MQIFEMGLGKTFYKKFFPIFLILSLTGCALQGRVTRGYKSIPVGKSSPGIDAIILSIYTVKTETVFKVARHTADGSEETVESSGIALAIAPDLLIALDHVVSDYEISYSTPFGKVVVPAEKLSETTYLMGGVQGLQSSRDQDGAPLPVATIEAIFRDRDSDLALFRVISGTGFQPVNNTGKMPVPQILNPLPIPFGRSSELRVGDVVYVVGNAFHLGLNVRQGIVSALRAPDRARNANINPENTIMVSNGLVPGDSGGPVLAIRNGHFEIVGLAQGMIAAAPNLGMALKIETILERIKDYWGEPFIKGSPWNPAAVSP